MNGASLSQLGQTQTPPRYLPHAIIADGAGLLLWHCTLRQLRH